MSSKMPPAMRARVDHWLEHHGWSTKDWEVQPVLGAGLSIAQVWRLAPARNATPSDSDILREKNAEHGYAIRNWGRSTRDRRSIQQVLFFQKAAHLGLKDRISNGLSFVGDSRNAAIVPDVLAWPDQNWCLEYAASIWTIEDWRPGVPLASVATISDSLLQEAFDVLKRLHATGRQLGIKHTIAPGLLERLERMNHWSSIVPGWWHQRIEQFDEKLSPMIERERLNTIMDRAFEHLRNRGAAITARLQKMLDGKVDCHWIVRDLWRENILIDHQRISGIVDFGASRIDWPAFDIVRWISSWLAPDDPRVSECFRAYPVLAEDDYRFLDYLGTLLSLLQWLEWLLSSQMSFVGQEARVRSRMIELDQRLSRIGERIPSANGHHAFW